MTSHRMQFSAVAVALSTLFIASSAAQPGGKVVLKRNPATATKVSSVRPAANWTFEGCWTQFAAGPCRDVFRDQQGGYWICRDCGTTGNPGPGKCSPISSATLATGFWCS
jgi:hypothetical protein